MQTILFRRPAVTFLMLLVISLLVGCGAEETPTPEIAENACRTTATDPADEEGYALPGPPYIENELILTGDPDHIQQVVDELPELFSEENGAQFCNTIILQYPGEKQELGGIVPTAIDWETQLYALPEGIDPWEAINSVYELVLAKASENSEDPLLVFADPNYLTGYDVSGDPTNGHSGIAGAGTALPSLTGSDLEDHFWDQWALGAAGNGGIELLDVNRNRTVGEDGTGIEVAMFDTSPYRSSSTVTVTQVTPPLALRVATPVAVPANAPTTPFVNETLKEHGLYVAGLVHAVAPESTKVLVRVLNDTAQGDLYSLVDALYDYAGTRIAGNGTLANTVLNLSLGVHPDAGALSTPQDVLDKIQLLIDTGIPAYVSLLEDGSLAVGLVPIPALHKPFMEFHALGAVSVAAAGNDSASNSMQVPAGYQEVIGVSASQHDGDEACYSNLGQLAAPGGSGTVEGACLPIEITASCSAEAGEEGVDCDRALISLVSESNGLTDTYAYWIGTSFSTPLVSGLSALALQRSGGAGPDTVFSAVQCGAGGPSSALMPATPGNILGIGRINVPDTLACLP